MLITHVLDHDMLQLHVGLHQRDHGQQSGDSDHSLHGGMRGLVSTHRYSSSGYVGAGHDVAVLVMAICWCTR